MTGSRQTSEEYRRILFTSWSWIALLIICLSCGFFVLRTCTLTITSVESIFPDGFTGPTKIKLGKSAPSHGWKGNTLLVRFDNAGNVRANGDDYERLGGVVMGVYRYEDGKAINLYMPHSGQETKGPWFERLAREVVVEGDVVISEECIKGRIGTVTRN